MITAFMKFSLLLLLLLFVVRRGESEEYQCGEQAGGKLCPEGLCCSNWGHCGSTDDYCGEGNCQMQCPDEGLRSVISREQFEEMLLHRNHPRCRAPGVYTYEAFIEAAKSFPGFGNVGNDTTRKRDIAAFLAQTSYMTNAGWPDAPDGPYSWGYCLFPPNGPISCVPDDRWPCVPGKRYYPRAPFRLQYNYNYGQVGEALGLDLLSDPDLVATDAVISFKTAIFVWMTSQLNKPSCHDVMSEKWVPSESDIIAGRVPGYGVTTNILNGVQECGKGEWNIESEYRMGFYRRYCHIFGIAHGDHLDCYNQQPFGPGLFRASI